jgi:dTMP kinase
MLGGVARFIVFEGGEASGKSTQSARLAARLGAVHTREPGGTAVGARLRELLLDARTTGLDDRAEALLMAADRAQHVAEVIRPALDGGRHVVCDRYIGSTLAYQGYGRGLPVAELRRLSAWAAGGLWPDLIVLLDVPRSVAQARRSAAPDRLESAGDEFHERVLRGYRALAAADPARWVTIDGTGPADEVAAAVWAEVTAHLPGLAAGSHADERPDPRAATPSGQATAPGPDRDPPGANGRGPALG